MRVSLLPLLLVLWAVLPGCDPGGEGDDASAGAGSSSPQEPPDPADVLDPASSPSRSGGGAWHRPPLKAPPADPAERRARLVALLENGDSEQLRFAQRTLATDPDGRRVAALLSAVIERSLDRNPFLAANAMGAVSPQGPGPFMKDTLVRCMTRATDPQVQRLAVARYAESIAEADPALVAEVATSTWSPVAMQALGALSAMEDREAAAGALLAVIDRVGPFARAPAYVTLGELGATDAVPLLEEAAGKARGGSSTESGAALAAGIALARLGHSGGMDLLRSMVMSLPLDAVAGSTGPEEALAMARDPEIRKRLIAQATGARPEASAAAIHLLSQYPLDDEVRAALATAAARPEWPPAVEALTVIHGYAPAEARVRTLAMLEENGEEAWERRYAACLVLGRMKDPKTAQPMADRLGREAHDGVGRKIVDALGLLADTSTVPALLEYMKADPAPTPDVAGRAFQVRVNLIGPMADAAVEAVETMIADGVSAAVLPHALRVLGQSVKGPRSAQVLEAHLKHADTGVRVAAATALGDRGLAASRDALAQRYAREPDEFVAESILLAIERIDLRNP